LAVLCSPANYYDASGASVGELATAAEGRTAVSSLFDVAYGLVPPAEEQLQILISMVVKHSFGLEAEPRQVHEAVACFHRGHEMDIKTWKLNLACRLSESATLKPSPTARLRRTPAAATVNKAALGSEWVAVVSELVPPEHATFLMHKYVRGKTDTWVTRALAKRDNILWEAFFDHVKRTSHKFDRVATALGPSLFQEVRGWIGYKNMKSPWKKQQAMQALLCILSWDRLFDHGLPAASTPPVITQAPTGVLTTTISDARGLTFAVTKRGKDESYSTVAVELNDGILRRQPVLQSCVTALTQDRALNAIRTRLATTMVAVVGKFVEHRFGHEVASGYQLAGGFPLQSAVAFLDSIAERVKKTGHQDEEEQDDADDAPGDDLDSSNMTPADSVIEALFRYANSITTQDAAGVSFPPGPSNRYAQCYRRPLKFLDDTNISEQLREKIRTSPTLLAQLPGGVFDAVQLRLLLAEKASAFLEYITYVEPLAGTLGSNPLALTPFSTTAHLIAAALKDAQFNWANCQIPQAVAAAAALGGDCANVGLPSPLNGDTAKSLGRCLVEHLRRRVFDKASVQSKLLGGVLPYLVLLRLSAIASVADDDGDKARTALTAAVDLRQRKGITYQALFFGAGPDVSTWRETYRIEQRMEEERGVLRNLSAAIEGRGSIGTLSYTRQLVLEIENLVAERSRPIHGTDIPRLVEARAFFDECVRLLDIRLPSSAAFIPPLVEPLAEHAFSFDWPHVPNLLTRIGMNFGHATQHQAMLTDSTHWRQAVVTMLVGPKIHKRCYPPGSTVVGFKFTGDSLQLVVATAASAAVQGPPASLAVSADGAGDRNWADCLNKTAFADLASVVYETALDGDFENLSYDQKILLTDAFLVHLGVDPYAPGLYLHDRLRRPFASAFNCCPPEKMDGILRLVRDLRAFSKRLCLGLDPGYAAVFALVDAVAVSEAIRTKAPMPVAKMDA
jgi:hypothetical protein